MAVAALRCVHSLISDSIALMPKRYDTTYLERARLWAILVGTVSSKKTRCSQLNAIVNDRRTDAPRGCAGNGAYKNHSHSMSLKEDGGINGWPTTTMKM